MADHGRSILTVLTDCSAGAATHVAEESDAGEADSTALDALLSPYPLVFCCVHQLLFPCLEVLIHGTSPPRAVSCKAYPVCCIDVERLQVSHADVLVLQPWTASGSLP